jgi:hypothetical protein
MTDQSTLAHEAGHVVGALLAGHHIESVELGGTKNRRAVAGLTSLDLESGGFDFYGHLIATLMGPMAAATPAPGWPPLPDLEGENDEHVAAIIVNHLRLTKADYMAAVALASHWLADPLVKSAIAKVAHALGQTGFLTDAQVRDLLGRGLVEWLELADPPRQSEELLA